MEQCAGILFCCKDKYLLLKRAKEGSWDLPGGHLDEGETAVQAALRETQEEAGVLYSGKLKQISRTLDEDVEYTTFLANVDGEFQPQLNDEHTDFQWASINSLPDNVHPYLERLLQSLGIESKHDTQDLTELDVAKKIRDGEMSSPQKFGEFYLFPLRISGTGVSYRTNDEEFVYRPPEYYTSDEFLQRCNGLPVILTHPPGQALTGEEFADRVIGTIVLPYLKAEENAPWGIARIYGDDIAQAMIENQLSTSPGVVWKNKTVNDTMSLDDGSKVMIEGKPSLIDHLAIVKNGVWDKGGEPSGVQVEMTATSRKDSANPSDSLKGVTDMADETVVKHEPAAEHPAHTGAADAKKDDGGGLPEIMAMLQQIVGRLDKLEAGEAKEEEKVPGIHDTAMPTEPLPTPGTTAPTAADNTHAEPTLASRIDAVEKKIGVVNDEGAAEIAETMAAADSAYSALGKRALQPMPGEKPKAFKRRILNDLKGHSAQYKDVDFSDVKDGNILNIAQSAILAAAMDAANSPASVPAGMLREVTKDFHGRKIVEFIGDAAACWAPFKAEKRLVTKFNTQFA